MEKLSCLYWVLGAYLGKKENKPVLLTMSCSRNSKFDLCVTLFFFQICLKKSQPTCSLETSICTGIILQSTFSFRIHTYQLKGTTLQVSRNTAKWLLWYGPVQAWKTTMHIWQLGPIVSLLLGRSLFKRSCCSLGQSLTSEQKTEQ